MTASRRAGASRPSSGKPSPRRRLPRGSLTPERIVDAAYRVAVSSDLAALSIQKIAAAAGCAPMAIYRHFNSVNAIADRVLDRFVGDADVAGHDVDPASDPEGWLVATFLKMHAALVAAPGVVSSLGRLRYMGDGMLDVLDRCLGVLSDVGLSEAEAVDAFHLLAAFTLGAAGIGNVARDAGGLPAGASRLLGLVAERPARVAHVVAMAPTLARRFVAPDIERQLTWLVRGLTEPTRSWTAPASSRRRRKPIAGRT